MKTNNSSIKEYEVLTSTSVRRPKDNEEQPKLNIGDIVTINTPLTSFDTNIGGRYKVMVIDTANEKYGIAPECSPFEIPKYFNRKDLILVYSVAPATVQEKSFLFQEGDFVSFKISSCNKILTGHIIEKYLKIKDSYKNEKNYFEIKSSEDSCLYFIEESNIIEKLCISASEPEQQKAVNMKNNIRQPEIGIGDIVSMSFPEVPFDSSTDNQYKVTDISLKDGEYGLVHVYTPFETPKFCNKNNLILRRKAGEKTPFLFQKGDLVSFKLLWCNDVRYGQIKELLSAATNFYKIKDLKDACLYLIEESDIEKITYTAPDCKPVKPDTITGLTITKAESWSPIKTIETTGNIEEKPLNIKIVKKQIKLNFKN